MKLNEAAYRHARELVEAGKVDRTSAWSFDARDSNALLGDPPDWSEYRLWFLGRRPEADEKTKAAWAYPYGKGGKVYRSALVAIRQRAGQQGHREIFDAAGRLLELIDREHLGDVAILSELTLEDGEAPKTVEILKAGTLHRNGRTIAIKPEHLESMVRYFNDKKAANPNFDLVIDYNHATLDAGASGGHAPAAGWIDKLWVEGDRLFGRVKEWTPAAGNALRAHEYRYLSAVPEFAYIDAETGRFYPARLHSVALTNVPVLKSLQPLWLNEIQPKGGEHMYDEIRKELGLDDGATEKDILEAIRELKSDRVPKPLAEALALSENPTVEEATRKVEELKAERVPSKVVQALGLSEGAGVDAAVQKIIELRGTKDADLVQRLAELEAKLRERDIDDVIKAALSDGKIFPAEESLYRELLAADFDKTKKLIDELPQRVPLLKRKAKPEPKDGKVPLSEYERKYMEQLGLTEEQFRKHNPPNEA